MTGSAFLKKVIAPLAVSLVTLWCGWISSQVVETKGDIKSLTLFVKTLVDGEKTAIADYASSSRQNKKRRLSGIDRGYRPHNNSVSKIPAPLGGKS